MKEIKNLIQCISYMTKLMEADSRFRTNKFNFWNRTKSSTQGERDMWRKRELKALSDKRKYQFLLGNLIGKLKKKYGIK